MSEEGSVSTGPPGRPGDMQTLWLSPGVSCWHPGLVPHLRP